MAEALSVVPRKRAIDKDEADNEADINPAKSCKPSQEEQSKSGKLNEKLSSLISKLIEDRKHDEEIMSGVRTKYEVLCAQQIERLDGMLQETYNNCEEPIQNRINQLNEKVGIIRKLEEDIQRFKMGLHRFVSDV